MTKRKVVLANNQFYHVFNRSVGKENIFLNKRYLNKFLNLIEYYRFSQPLRYSKFQLLNIKQRTNYLKNVMNSPLVEIYAYSVMPNHYHLLLQQLQDNGVNKLIATIQNSYAKYFNLTCGRTGTVFQNSFRTKLIPGEEEYIHVARYIHLNHVTSYIMNLDDLKNSLQSSFYYYSQNIDLAFLNKEMLLKIFGNCEELIKFTKDQVNYQRELAKIKDLAIDR